MWPDAPKCMSPLLREKPSPSRGPESFKVLARELRALGLNIELVRAERGKNGTGLKSSGKSSEAVAAKEA